ncbi:MAG TPA: DUF1579 family protein [Gemmataceae bacterium]|jgi:hypothetical protein|nr:DUF1579 family protein [Gemmataceae bacterium]
MRRVTTAIAILVFAGIPTTLCADDAPKRSAELQVLERFIGNWETEITVKPSGDTYKTTEIRKWSKEGQFVLSEDLNLASKKEAHFLITYDSNVKAYRSCFIDDAITIALLGTWDEATQTMKWTGSDGTNKHDGTYRFIDRDHVEWTVTATGPDKKVVVELVAKQTRKK